MAKPIVPEKSKFLLCDSEAKALDVTAKAFRVRFPTITDEQYERNITKRHVRGWVVDENNGAVEVELAEADAIHYATEEQDKMALVRTVVPKVDLKTESVK